MSEKTEKTDSYEDNKDTQYTVKAQPDSERRTYEPRKKVEDYRADEKTMYTVNEELAPGYGKAWISFGVTLAFFIIGFALCLSPAVITALQGFMVGSFIKTFLFIVGEILLITAVALIDRAIVRKAGTKEIIKQVNILVLLGYIATVIVILVKVF